METIKTDNQYTIEYTLLCPISTAHVAAGKRLEM